MTIGELRRSLSTLCSELVEGAPEAGAFVLNPGDAGMLGSLDRITAADASATPPGGASVAAHVEHVRFGLSLLNRWADGEDNPFEGARWAASWERTTVSDPEWQELREGLRAETARWLASLSDLRDVSGPALDGAIGSVVHLAYHLGAIRQIDRALRGPPATD